MSGEFHANLQYCGPIAAVVPETARNLPALLVRRSDRGIVTRGTITDWEQDTVNRDTEHLGPILVTGGAGFIGSAVIRHLIDHTDYDVVNVDCLTYSGTLGSVSEPAKSPRYQFEKADIRDRERIRSLLGPLRHEGVPLESWLRQEGEEQPICLMEEKSGRKDWNFKLLMIFFLLKNRPPLVCRFQ